MTSQVTLKIGERVFVTSTETLLSRPDSMLAKLLEYENGGISELREEIFIDRSGDSFSPVLEYLRSGELVLAGVNPELVKREADFYWLPGLVRLCEEYKKRTEKEMTAFFSAFHERSRFKGKAFLSAYGLRLPNLKARQWDMSYIDFSAASLSGSSLKGCNFAGATFDRADLSGVKLPGANLFGANFTEANLCGADLTAATLRGANFTNANLQGTNLTRCRDMMTNFRNANLSGVILNCTMLTFAALDGVNWNDVVVANDDDKKRYYVKKGLTRIPLKYMNDFVEAGNSPLGVGFRYQDRFVIWRMR